MRRIVWERPERTDVFEWFDGAMLNNWKQILYYFDQVFSHCDA